MSEDSKPDVGAEDKKPAGETITIRVRDQTGEETFFKVKKTTRMEKVFSTYAQRKGVQASALRFLLDGDRVDPNQTPGELDLEDQDMIDCMLEQQGGW
ncbi:ubiquitin-related domain-containing protein [Tribonema minus]|uniref:Ubiquitin-related domain-containing protein n=1 Tax=Tribonema minus TaxID=303371 RepID=A0A835YTL0_9STRA|nr:ubiquitin-related domain-containing protein [Tribonema minus]